MMKKRMYIIGGLIGIVVTCGFLTHRISLRSEFIAHEKHNAEALTRVKVLPHCVNTSFKTECGAPYQFVASIMSKAESIETIELRSLKIETSKGKVLFEKENVAIDCETSKLTDNYTCYYIVPEIGLPFEELQVHINYQLVSSFQRKAHNEKLILKPMFYREHSNDFWDALMSV